MNFTLENYTITDVCPFCGEAVQSTFEFCSNWGHELPLAENN